MKGTQLSSFFLLYSLQTIKNKIMEKFEDQEFNHNQKPMSVKDWVITLLILAIPLVGFIMLFVYAFGSNENQNRQNWAKAQLIVMAIFLGIALLVMILFGSIFAAAMASGAADNY